MLNETSFNRTTHEILGAAIEVHRVLGPGLFERVYEPCFHYELGVRKLQFETQRVVRVLYKGMRFGATYRVGSDCRGRDRRRNEVRGSLVACSQCAGAHVHEADELPIRLVDQLQRTEADGWSEAFGAAGLRSKDTWDRRRRSGDRRSVKESLRSSVSPC